MKSVPVEQARKQLAWYTTICADPKQTHQTRHTAHQAAEALTKDILRTTGHRHGEQPETR